MGFEVGLGSAVSPGAVHVSFDVAVGRVIEPPGDDRTDGEGGEVRVVAVET